jgi:hypothetical protein
LISFGAARKAFSAGVPVDALELQAHICRKRHQQTGTGFSRPHRVQIQQAPQLDPVEIRRW